MGAALPVPFSASYLQERSLSSETAPLHASVQFWSVALMDVDPGLCPWDLPNHLAFTWYGLQLEQSVLLHY